MTIQTPAYARVNITWAGHNDDLQDPVSRDLDDATVLQIATEAVCNGLPGIPSDPNVNFNGYAVDRPLPTEEKPDPPLIIRPKTPFGA